jgi:hypothetical protein
MPESARQENVRAALQLLDTALTVSSIADGIGVLRMLISLGDKTVARMAAKRIAEKMLEEAANKGELIIVDGGAYSASELLAAETLAQQGRKVVLRPPVGTRLGGGTSDLLVDGVRYDVYTPTTSNPSRIISAIAKKNTQTEGIVLDLTQTSVSLEQLGNILSRVNGAGAKNIRDIVIIGGK